MPPDRPVQTTLAFHASRIVIDLGVLLAMASMSMTFVVAPSGDRSALEADALPAILLLLPIFAVTLIPDHTRPLHPVLGWASMVLGLAALPYAFVKMLDASVLADTLGGSVGIGSRVLVLGCVVTLVGIGVGIVRDLMGWPSGGTPGRRSSFRTTKNGHGKKQPAPGQRAAQAGGPVAGTEGAAATQVMTVPRPSAPEPAAATGAAEPSTPDPESDPAPLGSQPEIVFPDTGAVVREAEADDVPDSDDDTMSTAERADAAIDDGFLSLFEGAPDDDEDPASPQG